MSLQTIQTDVLVIGGGIAGSFAAIRARQLGAGVLLANKGMYGRDGAASWMAGPSFQAALHAPDSPEAHARDIIQIGRFLADQELIYDYTVRLPQITQTLEDFGVRFRKQGGQFVTSRLPGQSYPRNVEVPRTCVFTGIQYRRVVPRALLSMGIPVLHDMFVVELVQKDGVIAGAMALDIRAGEPVYIKAKSVILATGGFMGNYLRTVVPFATGDGVAMAYRSGVEVADMEMADFYTYVAVWPPMANKEEWPALLVYYLNGKLLNNLGEEYTKHYSGAWKVPPRAAASEIRAGRAGPHGGVFLSIRHLPTNLVDYFLNSLGEQRWLTVLSERGFDLQNEALEIIPAAITSLGGCRINRKCETNLHGLYAAGEVASGHQGAYLMIGNMVGTSCATGQIAGEQVERYIRSLGSPPECDSQIQDVARNILRLREKRNDGCRPIEIKRNVGEILNKYAYLVGRSNTTLLKGLALIEDLEQNFLPRMYVYDFIKRFSTEWVQALEAINIVEIARLILRSALERTESRGVHFRDDYPDENPSWLKRIVIRKSGGVDCITHQALPMPHVKPSTTHSTR